MRQSKVQRPKSKVSLLRSPRAAAQTFRFLHRCAAAFLFVLILILASSSSNAAFVRVGPFTNSINGPTADTNDVIAIAVSGPVANADGSFTTQGLPVRLHLTADGSITNYFAQNNYMVSNKFMGEPIVFRVPLDSGPTVYSMYDLRISGYNTFVTQILNGGTNGAVTFNQITNGLGYAPLPTVGTNGFIGKVDSTNISVAQVQLATNGLILKTDATNAAVSVSVTYSNSIYSDYTTRIALLSALSLTNAFATNAAGVNYSGGRIYISTNYDGLGTALAIGLQSTNYANGISNALSSLHSLSLTNAFATNATGVSYSGGRAYISTNYDGLGTALAIGLQSTNYANGISNALVSLQSLSLTNAFATNAAGVSYSGGRAYISTNYDALGAALAIGLQGTNFTIAVSNSLAGQITAGGISAANATNLVNSTTGVVGTNGSPTVMKFTSSGTNAITAIAAPLTNGLVDKSITNNAATIALLNSSSNVMAALKVSATNGFSTNQVIAGGRATNGFAIYDSNIKVHATDTTVFFSTLSGPTTVDIALSDTGGGQADIEGPQGQSFQFNALGEIGMQDSGGETVRAGPNEGVMLQDGNAHQVQLDTNVGNFTITGGGSFSGEGFALSHTSSSNLQAEAKAQVTNIVNALSSGGVSSSITNAFGTNLPNGLLSNRILFYPTNFDIAGGSNFLASSKVSSTNGFGINPTFTNDTALEGSVSFGITGQATNIFSSTNYLYFVGAGSGIVTNGAFIWNSSLGVYTNWLTSCIVSNNTSAWLVITNGVSLYSLSGSSPVGAYSIVSGASPAPAAYYTAALNDHMIMLGYWSVSNQMAQSNALFTNMVLLATNNYIANNGGFGTNARLYSTRFLWNSTELSLAGPSNPGSQMDFASAAWGQANTNNSSGFGGAILSGATNRMVADGGGLIVGGIRNTLIGGSGNADIIIGGSWNTINGSAGISSVDANFLGGGFSNTIQNVSTFAFLGGGYDNALQGAYAINLGGIANTNLNDGSVILGGSSNRITGTWSIAAGRNATVTGSNSFVWSDGTATSTATNSQFLISGTNGLCVNGPFFLGVNNTNSGIYFRSNTFSLWATTNVMGVGDYVEINSNGWPVRVWNSNGVYVFKNLWQ